MKRKSYFRMIVGVLGFLALASVVGGMMFNCYPWFAALTGFVSDDGAVNPSFVASFVIGMALILTWMGVMEYNDAVNNIELEKSLYILNNQALTASREHLALVHIAFSNGDAKAVDQLLQLHRDLSLEQLHVAAIRINMESAQRIGGLKARNLVLDAVNFAIRHEKGWEPIIAEEHALLIANAIKGQTDSLLRNDLNKHQWLRRILGRSAA